MRFTLPRSLCLFSGRSGNGNGPFLKAAALAALLFTALTPVLALDRDASDEAKKKAKETKPKVLPGTLVVPLSTQTVPTSVGKAAHTNIRFIMPATAAPNEAPPYGGYAYETPASLACVYALVTTISGCNPNSTVKLSTYGGQTIAIVDAYDDPQAAADLAYFSDVNGLPFNFEKFNVVYEGGTQPEQDYTGGWELEESLDIEYAHAMAPNATIYLVEAQSNYYSDLFAAVQIATSLVQCGQVTTCSTVTGYGEVSMSWGGAEFSGETSYDTYFSSGTSNVVFLASSGDSPGVEYPSASPGVISVGGTSNERSLANGNLLKQVDWSEGGGGLSDYEAGPSFQSGLPTSITGGARATPDVSAVANPYTGVWVYDSFPMDGYYTSSNWWTVGGTSVAAPTWAGIINAAESKSGVWAASTTAELTSFYTTDYTNATNYPHDFTDINYGYCNFYAGSSAGAGYDLCTGLGSPNGLGGK